MSGKVYLDLDQKALDDAYDQQVWAPNSKLVNARLAALSETTRQRIGAPTRVAYGPAPVEGMDIYRTSEPPFPASTAGRDPSTRRSGGWPGRPGRHGQGRDNAQAAAPRRSVRPRAVRVGRRPVFAGGKRLSSTGCAPVAQLDRVQASEA